MKAIILAAGQGTRLQCEQSELPMALRLLNGKPLIHYVLENLNFIPKEDIAIVVGYRKEMVIEACGPAYRFVEQKRLDGTAKATLCAEPLYWNYSGPILVCYCDMPFLSRKTYMNMFEAHIESGAGNTLLAGRDDPIPPFGRLIYDASGKLTDVIEESACDEAQKMIPEVNVGIQVLQSPGMWAWLPKITNENPKKEYYLTGAVSVLAAENIPQKVVTLADPKEMLGINTMEDLQKAEAIIQNTQW
jgi:bifunctional N-acetylglucosamine-1-phosphate-uridyltransferase/glucosamine-1-phosphate-acetyltransferase GlmU-like protein